MGILFDPRQVKVMRVTVTGVARLFGALSLGFAAALLSLIVWALVKG